MCEKETINCPSDLYMYICNYIYILLLIILLLFYYFYYFYYYYIIIYYYYFYFYYYIHIYILYTYDMCLLRQSVSGILLRLSVYPPLHEV